MNREQHSAFHLYQYVFNLVHRSDLQASGIELPLRAHAARARRVQSFLGLQHFLHRSFLHVRLVAFLVLVLLMQLKSERNLKKSGTSSRTHQFAEKHDSVATGGTHIRAIVSNSLCLNGKRNLGVTKQTHRMMLRPSSISQKRPPATWRSHVSSKIMFATFTKCTRSIHTS
jgi:hypothetical protein